MGQLRWNPMLGEWVIITPRRASRPFQDKERICPFCPGQEETAGEWKVLTLENKFPALSEESGPVPLDERIVMEAPGYGACRVIIQSRDHNEQFEDMDETQLERVFKEYLRVFKEMESKKGIVYVAQFENRGKAIGVSLNHPHAQVYALPFVPSKIEREIEQARSLWEKEDTCLVCETIENEQKAGVRIINESKNFISILPFSARLPYEVHIYPKEHVSSLIEIEDNLRELGVFVRDIAQRYTRVFDEIAYVMILHTRPSVGEHPYWHFHIEFYPPFRDRTRLKYLAGIESGTGTYTNDSTPEEKAKEMREAL